MLLPRYQTGFVPLADGAVLPYLRIGVGRTPLIVIPGAGDGTATAVEAAARLAWFFRPRARDYQILYLSRRQPIPPGFTTAQHAADYSAALDQLGQPASFVECNSAGGPIGQVLAAERPDLVRGLILSVTLHRTDNHLRRVLGEWASLARRGDWPAFFWSGIEHTLRPRSVARIRPLRPLLRLMRPPRDPERLLRIFEELMSLDNRAILPAIRCPALVIGGAEDRVISPEIQREMAALIPNSRLILYPGYGHGNDQENPDYRVQIDRFIQGISGS